uniref:Uncharacterized protein n=1 Tax=Rhizophora mucronata TaxID=61149 RepID=A0A2P2Q9S4_RHIMU
MHFSLFSYLVLITFGLKMYMDFRFYFHFNILMA